MLKCDDDLGLLGYQGVRTLKVAVVYKSFYQAGGRMIRHLQVRLRFICSYALLLAN